MTSTDTTDLKDNDVDRRKYMLIANVIREDIIAGRLRVGDKLPPEHTLAPRFNCAKLTLRRALKLLRTEGYVETTQGMGTYIRATEPGNLEPAKRYDLTLALIDEVKDALERLEAHVHRTAPPPLR